MSGNTVNKSLELLNQAVANWQERIHQEDKRRASLTPAERQAEDADLSRRRQATERRELEDQIITAARPYRGHETLTLHEFGSLLHAIDPADTLGFAFYRSTKADATLGQLASATGASLLPVNTRAPAAQLRFKTVELIAWAHGKGFGNVEILTRALGAEPAAQAIVSAPPGATPVPVKVTPARSEIDVSHPKLVEAAVEALIREARELTGKPNVEPTALPFQRADIYERYCESCKAQGIDPRSESSVRQIVNKRGYRLAGGNRGGLQRELLSQLRSKKKPAT